MHEGSLILPSVHLRAQSGREIIFSQAKLEGTLHGFVFSVATEKSVAILTPESSCEIFLFAQLHKSVRYASFLKF